LIINIVQYNSKSKFSQKYQIFLKRENIYSIPKRGIASTYSGQITSLKYAIRKTIKNSFHKSDKPGYEIKLILYYIFRLSV
jgi:hypothetical protein